MDIENIVVRSSPYTEKDLDLIFGDNEGRIEEEILFVEDVDLSVLVKDLGIYPSTTRARAAGRVGALPKGYTVIKASKTRFLFLWNPSE
jgi:hypothetical protein